MFETKKCSRCKTIKTLTEFSISKINNDGFSYTCRTCAAEVSQEWRIEHKEYYTEYQKQYAMGNISKINARRNLNIEKIRERDRIREAKTRSTLKGALDCRIRNGINGTLRRGEKGNRKWEVLLGYTVEQLRRHLEKQFTNGMDWERFLKGEIHIDHKIPRAAFNFEKAEDIDFKQCWGLKNLQPLWKKDNLKKHDKIDKPFQPSFAMAI